MRCFISIELPENVRVQIFHAFEKLKNSKLANINFVNKNNLHLILKFFRNISVEEAEKIKEALSDISYSKFPVETGEIGFFPNESYIKIIWVELISHEFEFLKNVIDEKLAREGFNKDNGKFVAYVNVARVKSVKNKKMFIKKLKDLNLKKIFFIAEDFSLIKSVLTRKGPEYKNLKSFVMLMRR